MEMFSYTGTLIKPSAKNNAELDLTTPKKQSELSLHCWLICDNFVCIFTISQK